MNQFNCKMDKMDLKQIVLNSTLTKDMTFVLSKEAKLLVDNVHNFVKDGFKKINFGYFDLLLIMNKMKIPKFKKNSKKRGMYIKVIDITLESESHIDINQV